MLEITCIMVLQDDNAFDEDITNIYFFCRWESLLLICSGNYVGYHLPAARGFKTVGICLARGVFRAGKHAIATAECLLMSMAVIIENNQCHHHHYHDQS